MEAFEVVYSKKKCHNTVELPTNHNFEYFGRKNDLYKDPYSLIFFKEKKKHKCFWSKWTETD